MAVPIASVRWRLSSLAETGASVCASAACYRYPEDIGVVAVVVAELEFSDVQRQIFGADFVEVTHDAAFHQRPEALDCLGVHHTNNMLAATMPHEVIGVFVFEEAIGRMFV